jgi:hypothetical protein
MSGRTGLLFQKRKIVGFEVNGNFQRMGAPSSHLWVCPKYFFTGEAKPIVPTNYYCVVSEFLNNRGRLTFLVNRVKMHALLSQSNAASTSTQRKSSWE